MYAAAATIDAHGHSQLARCGSHTEVSQAVDSILDPPHASVSRTQALLEELGQCSNVEQAKANFDELRSRAPHDWYQIVNTIELARLADTSYSRAGLTMLADTIAAAHAEGGLTLTDLVRVFGHGTAGTAPGTEAGAQMLFGASDSHLMQTFELEIAKQCIRDSGSCRSSFRRSWVRQCDNRIRQHRHQRLGADAASRRRFSRPTRPAITAQQIASRFANCSATRTLSKCSRSIPMRWRCWWSVLPRPGAWSLRIGTLSMAPIWPLNSSTGLVTTRSHLVVNDVFGSAISDVRVEAVAQLFVNHPDEVFTALTDGYVADGQFGIDDGNRLGIMLGLTAFNPSNGHAADVRAELDRYVLSQVSIATEGPNTDAGQEAIGRLEILAVGTLVANALPVLASLESNESRVDSIVRLVDVASTFGSLVPTGRLATVLSELYGTLEGLSDSQISTGLRQYLTEAFSGSSAEIDAALREIAGMVDATVVRQYSEDPVATGPMLRRQQDTLHTMLSAVADNDVSGYLDTLRPGN